MDWSPIQKIKDKWYVLISSRLTWDERWADFLGPFNTYQEAETVCIKYWEF